MSTEATPVPAHLASEFFVWLWWRSEQQEGRVDLPEPIGPVTVWVDDRLAFRRPDDTKVTAVITGESPSNTLEARAALAGGKVVQELRFGLRRDDREFTATLKAPGLGIGQLKLPQVLSESAADAIRDRVFLYEEFAMVVGGLLTTFAEARTGDAWRSTLLPELREWLAGGASD